MLNAKEALSDIRLILDFRATDSQKIATIRVMLEQIPEKEFKEARKEVKTK